MSLEIQTPFVVSWGPRLEAPRTSMPTVQEQHGEHHRDQGDASHHVPGDSDSHAEVQVGEGVRGNPNAPSKNSEFIFAWKYNTVVSWQLN